MSDKSNAKTFSEFVKNGNIKFRDYIEKAANTGSIDDNIFAKSLSELVKNPNSKEFFDRTEITPNLRDYLKQLIARVYAKNEDGLFIFDTFMGGGKTHALALTYFLFKERSVAITIDEIQKLVKNTVNSSQLPEVELVDIDGNDLDKNVALNEQPKLKLFFGVDGTRSTVKDSLEKLGKPVIFLFDEILDFFEKRGDNYTADLAYLKTLIEGVVLTKNCIVIITIPTDMKGLEKYDKASNVFKTIERRATPINPIGNEENFGAILKKQIFERIDDSINSIVDIYVRKALAKEELNDQDLSKTYPFHPSVLDVFFNRFSDFKNFQKTRQSIRILASISANILKQINSGKKIDTPFITIGDIDLNDSKIKDQLTSPATYGINNLANIIDKDIASLTDFKRKVATALYLYSLVPEENKRGSTDSEVYFNLLPEDKGITDIKEIIESYEKSSWYLHYDSVRKAHFFKEEPNIYNMIYERTLKMGIPSSTITKFLEKLFEFNSDEINDIFLKTNNEVLPFNDEKLNIVIIHPELFDQNQNNIKEFIKNKLKSNTKNMNGIILILPGQPVTNLFEETKKHEAIEGLIKEFEKKKEKDKKEPLDRLHDEKEQNETKITSILIKLYNKLYWVAKNELKEHIFSIGYDLKEDNYKESILKYLYDNQKAYLTQYLNNLDLDQFFKTLIGDRAEYKVSEAYTDIEESTTIPYLTKKAFKEAINRSVIDKIIGYSTSSLTNNTAIYFGESIPNLNENGFIIIKQKCPPSPTKSGEKEVVLEPTAPGSNPTAPKCYDKFYEGKNYEEHKKHIENLKSLTWRFQDQHFDITLIISIDANNKITISTKSNKIKNIENILKDILDLSNDITVNITAHLPEELYREYESVS